MAGIYSYCSRYNRKYNKCFIIKDIFIAVCILIGFFYMYNNMKQPVTNGRQVELIHKMKQTGNTNKGNKMMQSARLREDKPTRNSNKVYKLLYWTTAFFNPDWYGLGHEPFKYCIFKNCWATNKKSEFNSSDGVLFLARKIDLKVMPKYRFHWQRWIFASQEAPPNEPSYAIYNGLFNATMTYSTKSEILLGFDQGRYIKMPKQITDSSLHKNFSKGRNKKVVWFVSNCNDTSKRMEYVRNLQKYIPVDIYGRCGTLQCDSAGSSTKCDSMLHTNYKFYLAFENSICVDYVTEKMGRALNNEIVPIVLGGFNYSTRYPRHSYIDIGDFKNPKELAEYLLVLDKDDIKYNTYYEWKKWYRFVEHERGTHQCGLCEYLNTYSDVIKVYDRLDMFWNTDLNCSTPQKFYEKVDKSSWV